MGTSLSCSRTMSWFNLRDGVVGEGEDGCRGRGGGGVLMWREC